uniref:Methyltransferase domain-containing protein n=1 Tax=Panagrolaimus sp. PS1159 TaxID=55785 RepID=A0AC35FZU4_9BILA
MYEIFFEKWPNLCRIKEDELLKLPYDIEIHEKCDSKLANFFEKTQKLSILKPFPTVLNNVEIPKHLFLKMKNKKEYEIKQLLSVFLKECEKIGVKTVIDIGCGKGNFIKILQYFGMKCIGIEANSEFCKAAKEANHAMIFNEFVTVNSIPKIRDIIDVHGPAALISLHGCGNLQKVLLHIKVSITTNKLPLLFTLGCCYHKRTNSSGTNEWAISETIKTKLKDASINLPTSALRLGCDRGLLHWTKQSPEQFEAHKNAVFNRAVIETIFPEETSIQRNTNRNLKGDLISTICDKHNILITEREAKEEELRKAFEKYSNFKNGIQPFSMLQSGIQASMETLILLDSAYFLKENNQPASFQSLFDVLQSPRNICLISLSA